MAIGTIGGTEGLPMLSKKLLAAFAAAALVFGAAACGSDDDDDAAATEEVTDVKDEAEEAVEEVADEVEDSTDDDTDSSDDGDSGDDGDIAMPLDLGDCIGVGMTYASVYLAMLGDEDAMQEALGDLEELKGDMPEDLQDEFTVLIEGFGDARNIMEASEFMETDEYEEADEKITAYLDEVCGS